MSRTQGTLTLFLVAAGLLAYILIFERGPAGGGGPRTPQRLFPQLEPSRVTAFTIVQSNSTIRVERLQNLWQLAAPLYPASALRIDNWLASVADLTRTSVLDATDLLAQPGGLAALGLQPARADITIEQGSARFQFHLGHRTPLGDKMYLQVVGADGVDITSALPLERLPASALEWRDPAVIHLAGLRPDRIRMRAASREYEVGRDAATGQWRLLRPRPARADTARVDQMLQQLQAVEITRFASDFASADLEPFGLEPPAAAFAFAEGTNVLLTLEFGHSPTNAPDQVYARRSNLPGVVVIPRSALELVALAYTDLLDYRLVDAVERVTRLEVQAGARFALERKPDGPWQFVEPAGLPADPALITTFLERLQSLRAVEVAKEIVAEPDLPSYGLAPPVRQYALLGAAPAMSGSSTSSWLRLEFGTNRAEQIYVRRSDENPVYVVRMEDALSLPGAAFELRDRRLWEFTTNQVQSLTITHQGVARTLLRSPGGQWTFAPGSQGLVNTFALEDAVDRLGRLRARRWLAQGGGQAMLEHFGIPQVAHQLKLDLLVNGRPETRVIDFGATSPSGGPFASVTLETGPTVFEVPLELFHPYSEVVRSMSLPKPSTP